MSLDAIKFTKVSITIQVISLFILGVTTYFTTDIEYKKLLLITYVVFGLTQIFCGEILMAFIFKMAGITPEGYGFKRFLFVISEIASFFVGVFIVLCAAAALHNPKEIASSNKEGIDDVKCAAALLNPQVVCPKPQPPQPAATEPKSGSKVTPESEAERNALSSLIDYLDKAFIEDPKFGVFGFAFIFWLFTRSLTYFIYGLCTKKWNPAAIDVY